MAPAKKQKLDDHPSTGPMMSAFAARQKLRGWKDGQMILDHACDGKDIMPVSSDIPLRRPTSTLQKKSQPAETLSTSSPNIVASKCDVLSVQR